MDVKTLSTIIGHVSSATTLNVYAHVTDDMQKQAAAKIDRGIGKVEISAENPQAVASRTLTDFKPKRGKRRYWGRANDSLLCATVSKEVCKDFLSNF
jgi:hypothetical protein